jgi:hypothetical protein
MYLNMFAALVIMTVLSAIFYGQSEEKAQTEQEAMEAAAAEAGVTLPQGDSEIMDEYKGNVVVTEEGSPMLRAVQKSLQHADAVMLKQNEIHRELIDAAGKK